ncbi:MAG: hypothetical protein JW729_06480 [Bacteroidales bacterium]|nr:hypothetical protein [Bacteroidales bacterium]MBN2747513.1 hypothetical protein [Bacteroidales bacterium]
MNKGQLVTRGIKHWGLSGYVSVLSRIKFGVTRQVSSPQSPTISYRHPLCNIVGLQRKKHGLVDKSNNSNKNKDRNEPHGILGTPAGLARTKRIIRTEKNLELQFLKLCLEIKLQDFKTIRTENQQNERKEKRKGN